MSAIKIRRGLDLPIPGKIESTAIVDGPPIHTVALLPHETLGIKIKLLVKEGDPVQLGQPLYVDKRDEAVLYTAPAGGVVTAVQRGERRAVQSVVIRVDRQESAAAFDKLNPVRADGAEIRAALCNSGLWPALRARPFGGVAKSDGEPSSLFVTAIDSQPLAPPPEAALAGREEHFHLGLATLGRITRGRLHLCTRPGSSLQRAIGAAEGVEIHEFSGPHPAGNPGVHINAIDPVGPGKVVWHIGYQDVADVGQFLATGRVPNARSCALVGPGARAPALLRTRRGAATADLARERVAAARPRVVSGSALWGAVANPDTPFGFLGRYANQVTILDDQPERHFLGWLNPVGERHTVTNTALAKLLGRRLRFDTALNGGHRAIVPIGSYEKVMPMNIMATQLIRYLAAGDLETAEKLGALELVEEDVALCEYVCPSKLDITGLLRQMLNRIQKEG